LFFARSHFFSTQEIGPFDKSFNAITGKNGSGKSNILDAIMFVFGATKASQLRVKDFSGLVFKEGLGDVSRASVTIVFSNTDRETSPAGYEDQDTFYVTRSVKHGDGSSKYMINGSVATQAKVHALFHSVQLNIDNPTFLVQQGQITKVRRQLLLLLLFGSNLRKQTRL
jgi:structural maintenance of chromosome 2